MSKGIGHDIALSLALEIVVADGARRAHCILGIGEDRGNELRHLILRRVGIDLPCRGRWRLRFLRRVQERLQIST